MDVKFSGMRAKVIYSVVVKVRRPRLFSRRLKENREVVYLPPGQGMPSKSSPNPEPGGFPHLIRDIAMLPASRLGATTDLSPLPGCLPPYSPALKLEVLMSYPPILTPGKACSLQMALSSSSSLVESVGAVQVRNTTVRLRSRTTSRISSFIRTDTSYRTMCSIVGDLPISQGRLQLDCGVWQNYYIQADVPSFESCLISRDYAIEVTVGVASQSEPAIQVRKSFLCSLLFGSYSSIPLTLYVVYIGEDRRHSR